MRNLSIKLCRIYVYYTNITLYHAVYSVRYYPRFHVTAVGLGTYYRGYGGPPVYGFDVESNDILSIPSSVKFGEIIKDFEFVSPRRPRHTLGNFVILFPHSLHFEGRKIM